MDNISVYFMVVAASSYSSVSNMFESDSTNSKVTVGTIVTAESTYTGDIFSTNEAEPRVVMVGTLAQINVSTISITQYDTDDMFSTNYNVSREMFVGTSATMSGTYSGGVFATNEVEARTAVVGTSGTLNSTTNYMFASDDNEATRSTMSRDLTAQEIEAASPTSESSFSAVVLLLNGE